MGIGDDDVVKDVVLVAVADAVGDVDDIFDGGVHHHHRRLLSFACCSVVVVRYPHLHCMYPHLHCMYPHLHLVTVAHAAHQRQQLVGMGVGVVRVVRKVLG